MPAPDIIERVARAIWDARETRFPARTRRSPDDMDRVTGAWESCVDEARAAIAAMREIDERMMVAGWRSQFEFVGGNEAEIDAAIDRRLKEGKEVELTRRGWRAAIDEALSEKESG